MSNRHLIDVGLQAFERGFLGREQLVDALAAIEGAPAGTRAEDFWRRADRLTAEQLDQLLLTTQGIAAASPPADPRAPTGPDEPATAPMHPASQRSRDTFSRRFSRVAVLGVGGMGEVIEFEDVRIGRRVAIKRVRDDVTGADKAGALLEREARVTGRLEHPNIVPVYDAGNDAAGAPYYVMRLLRHPTLAQVLSALRRRDHVAIAEYTLNKLVRCFIQICLALDFAHSRGVIHCDIKPANILVGVYGEVLLVDWGFCHLMHEKRSQRGGTPGYLAPEQLDTRLGSISPRTDIFALGAVLYDMLALTRAFPSTPLPTMLEAVRRGERPFPPPLPPSVRSPERRIAVELDEICLRALAYDPASRYQSAKEMAAACEAYLEGTAEKERRLKRARELVEQGDMLADNHREMMATRTERQAELVRLRAQVCPWDPPSTKQSLWDAEDREIVLDSVSIRTFQSAVAAYEHALDEVADYPPARLGLARLYWDELQRAQARRDEFDRVYFEGLVNQYDDGALGRPPRTDASLELHVRGGDAHGSLQLLGEVGRRMTEVRTKSLGALPLRVNKLEPGSYLLELTAAERSLRLPFLLAPGENLVTHIDVSPVSRAEPGEVLVTGGRALLGGHESSQIGRDLVSVDVPAFYIDRLPVTFGDYLPFVEACFARLGDEAARYLPLTEGGYLVRREGGKLLFDGLQRISMQGIDLMSLPVIGVDLECALSYALFRSERAGKSFRLPTEIEWEKAARGVDGRRYPWGDKFDAGFCRMRDSRAGRPRVEPVGAFPFDTSPYGVGDVAGGVAEWVAASDNGFDAPTSSLSVIARGGAWCDWAAECHLGARRPYSVGERALRVGFRLARDIDR